MTGINVTYYGIEAISEEKRMGCVSTITATNFPEQSQYINRKCWVCFHYDTSVWIPGVIIRDDREEPFETLIKLDDGRIVRGVECQYSNYNPYMKRSDE